MLLSSVEFMWGAVANQPLRAGAGNTLLGLSWNFLSIDQNFLSLTRSVDRASFLASSSSINLMLDFHRRHMETAWSSGLARCGIALSGQGCNLHRADAKPKKETKLFFFLGRTEGMEAEGKKTRIAHFFGTKNRCWSSK